MPFLNDIRNKAKRAPHPAFSLLGGERSPSGPERGSTESLNMLIALEKWCKKENGALG